MAEEGRRHPREASCRPPRSPKGEHAAMERPWGGALSSAHATAKWRRAVPSARLVLFMRCPAVVARRWVQVSLAGPFCFSHFG
jgi:hypothetical protein